MMQKLIAISIGIAFGLISDKVILRLVPVFTSNKVKKNSKNNIVKIQNSPNKNKGKSNQKNSINGNSPKKGDVYWSTNQRLFGWKKAAGQSDGRMIVVVEKNKNSADVGYSITDKNSNAAKSAVNNTIQLNKSDYSKLAKDSVIIKNKITKVHSRKSEIKKGQQPIRDLDFNDKSVIKRKAFTLKQNDINKL